MSRDSCISDTVLNHFCFHGGQNKWKDFAAKEFETKKAELLLLKESIADDEMLTGQLILDVKLKVQVASGFLEGNNFSSYKVYKFALETSMKTALKEKTRIENENAQTAPVTMQTDWTLKSA